MNRNNSVHACQKSLLGWQTHLRQHMFSTPEYCGRGRTMAFSMVRPTHGFCGPHAWPAPRSRRVTTSRILRARCVRETGIGSELRHGVTSGVSRETSLNKHATPHPTTQKPYLPTTLPSQPGTHPITAARFGTSSP